MNTKKVNIVEKLKKEISEFPNVSIFSDRGLTCGEIKELRRLAKENNSKLLVAPNRLMKIAFPEAKDPTFFKNRVFLVLSKDLISSLYVYELASKEIKKFIKPVCTLNNNVVLSNVDILEKLSKMKNEGGVAASMILPLNDLIENLKTIFSFIGGEITQE